MPPPSSSRRPELSPELPGDAALATTVMRRQRALAIRIAFLFLALILGLPLLNAAWPELAAWRFAGFPASWFLVGIALYPVTWALAAYFVSRSEALEADDARLVRERRRHPG